MSATKPNPHAPARICREPSLCDHGENCPSECGRDDLAPARGIAHGVVIAMWLWAAALVGWLVRGCS